MKICKVCNENLVEDEYHLFLASLVYKVTREKYADLIDGHDNLLVKHESTPRKVSTCAFIIFIYRVFTTELYPSLLRKETYSRQSVYLVP